MQSDHSQRFMRQVTFAHSYINCGEANPSITNTHSDTVGTAICGHLPFRRLQHWVSCPRTNWCVDRRGRESYRLPPKVEEPLYLLGSIEAELGGNVARPSDFETSSKMTRLQKKKKSLFFSVKRQFCLLWCFFLKFFLWQQDARVLPWSWTASFFLKYFVVRFSVVHSFNILFFASGMWGFL